MQHFSWHEDAKAFVVCDSLGWMKGRGQNRCDRINSGWSFIYSKHLHWMYLDLSACCIARFVSDRSSDERVSKFEESMTMTQSAVAV
jgi:hypothetical protein